MRKKILTILLFCFVFIPCAFVISACGGTGTDPGNNEGNGDGSATTTNPYTIQFMLDENTVFHTTTMPTNNSYITLPTNRPTKEGYIFMGWQILRPGDFGDYWENCFEEYFQYNPATSNIIKVFPKWYEDDGKSIIKVNPLIVGGETINFTVDYYEFGGGNINASQMLSNDTDTIDVSNLFVLSSGAYFVVERDFQEIQDVANLPISSNYNTFIIKVYKDGDEFPNEYMFSITCAQMLTVNIYNQNTLVDSFEAEEGSTISKPSNVSSGMSGYSQIGWTTMPGSKQLFDFENDPVVPMEDNNFNLYAVFSNGSEPFETLSIVMPNGKIELVQRIFEPANDANVVIPSFLYTHNVGKVWADIFNKESLESVILPNTLIELVESMFYDCINLRSVAINSAITEIPGHCFTNCYNLESVGLLDSITLIKEYAFSNCSSLASITLPENLEEIENNAFEYCAALTTVDFSNSYCSIGDYAFAYSGVQILNNINNLNAIGKYSFSTCTQLERLILPEEIAAIGEHAFEYCTSLKEISLSKVAEVKYGVLYNCSSLESLACATTLGDYFLNSNTDHKSTFPTTLTTYKFLQEEVDSSFIAFYAYSNIENIIMGKDVKIVNARFDKQPKFKSLIFEAGNEIEKFTQGLNLSSFTTMPTFPISLKEIVGQLYLGDAITTLNLDYLTNLKVLAGIISNTIETLDFSNMRIETLMKLETPNLTSLLLPDTLKLLYGIKTGKVEQIDFPASLTHIRNDAFKDYGKLRLVTFPANSQLKEIGNYAFYDSGLRRIDFPNQLEKIGDYAFSGEYSGCHLAKDASKQVTFPTTLKYIGKYAFYGVYMYSGTYKADGYKHPIKYDLEIPRNIEYIGEKGLYNVYNVGHMIQYKLYPYEITDGDTTTTHYGLFKGAEGTKLIGVDTLPERAFANNTIVRLDMSQCTFTTIPKRAFENCTIVNSEYIIYPSTLTTVEDEAFKLCTQTKTGTENTQKSDTLSIPKTITSYGSKIFLNSTFTSIEVPYVNSQAYSGMYGFLGSKSITSLILTNQQNFNINIDLSQIELIDFSKMSFSEEVFAERFAFKRSILILPKTCVLKNYNFNIGGIISLTIGGCKGFTANVGSNTGYLVYSNAGIQLKEISITNMETFDEPFMTSLSSLVKCVPLESDEDFVFNMNYATSIYYVDNIKYWTYYSRDEVFIDRIITVINSDKTTSFSPTCRGIPRENN